MAAAGIWKEDFRVRSYETDPTGRASVPSICNYLQEVAGNHAFRLGVAVDQLQEEHLTWVLTRLRVNVDHYPRWRDQIVVETWPSGVDGLIATRDFLLLDSAGRRLARATSGWMMIDMERRRPVRMPEIITSLVTPDRERAMADLSARLSEPPTAETGSGPISVRYSDLDVNGHVNNVRYLDWALESMAIELLQSSAIRELEVHFRAEAVLGDAVIVRTALLEDDASQREKVFAHVILQHESLKELARLRTAWSAL